MKNSYLESVVILLSIYMEFGGMVFFIILLIISLIKYSLSDTKV